MNRSKYEKHAAEMVAQAWAQPDDQIPITPEWSVWWSVATQKWITDCSTTSISAHTFGDAVRAIAAELQDADAFPPADVVEAAMNYRNVLTMPRLMAMRDWILARHAARETEE